MSDKFHEAPHTLEQRTSDILAVMDAAGLDRPAVIGASEGGLMAQLFAAQRPDRVDRLVLINTHPGRAGLLASTVAPTVRSSPETARRSARSDHRDVGA